MSNRTPLLALACLLAVFGVAGWWLDQPGNEALAEPEDSFGSPEISLAKFEKLETLAATACQCEFENGREKETDCWAAYQQERGDIQTLASATACYPISTMSDCFSVEGSDQCIDMGYSVVGHGVTVCSVEQARAIEQTWMSASQRVEDDLGRDHPEFSNRSDSAAEQAVGELLARLKRGEAIAIASSTNGCAG
ncbi:MAG: hypothetical protein HKO08_04250 [Erythrobacter sp.]|nr:hypothetical protein [Erythrobacter sp.]